MSNESWKFTHFFPFEAVCWVKKNLAQISVQKLQKKYHIRFFFLLIKHIKTMEKHNNVFKCQCNFILLCILCFFLCLKPRYPTTTCQIIVTRKSIQVMWHVSQKSKWCISWKRGGQTGKFSVLHIFFSSDSPCIGKKKGEKIPTNSIQIANFTCLYRNH